MSDSVQPHRRQPTRLPRPWDSPGNNTGVGLSTPYIPLNLTQQILDLVYSDMKICFKHFFLFLLKITFSYYSKNI